MTTIILNKRISTKNQTFLVCIFICLVMNMSFVYAEDNVKESDRKWSIEGGVRYSLLTPGGKMGSVVNDETKYSNLSDLGLDSAEGAFGISLGGRYKRVRLFFAGQQSSFSGEGVTTEDIEKGGITIPAGTALDTTMDLGINSLVVTYNLIPGEHELGIGAGLMVMNFKVSYTAKNSGANITIDETTPMPLLAISGTARWQKFVFQGVIGGAAVNYDGNKVAYGSVDVTARYMFYQRQNKGGLVSLGYRYIPLKMDFSYENNAFKADIDFAGPYLGLRFAY